MFHRSSRKPIPVSLFILLWLTSIATLSQAAAPMAKTPPPGFFRLMIGAYELTALFDGYLDIDPSMLLNTSAQQVQEAFKHQFISSPKARTAVNAFLVHTGEKLILVDTGAAKAFGPNLGFLIDHLRASGYTPEQVDVVLITHLHSDHINGLLTPDHKLAFPNAVVMTAKTEGDFWLSTEMMGKAPAEAQPAFKRAQEVVAVIQGSKKWQPFEPGAELFPGIKAQDTNGHTPGHSAYLITSNGESLLIIGDCIHVGAVQFAHPDVAIKFDTDPKKAVETRLALFQRVAKEALLVAGMHLPFPGLGHIRAEGKGFAWVPLAQFPPTEKAQPEPESKKY